MGQRAQILLLVLLLLTGVAAVTNRDAISDTIARVTSRGIRNNNPGNLRFSSDKWQGLSAEQTDDDFFQFNSPFWGIRAMARTLKNYQQRHGLNTIRQIISRWAPNTENNTDAYIASVAKQTGIDPDQPINVQSNLLVLVPAIIVHENGSNPYEAGVISDGVAAA